MKRSYLSRFVVDSVPASCSLEYVKECYEDYLNRHQDFKDYLDSIKVALDGNYPEFNELFDLSFKTSSFVLGKHSILNTLVKLYNYHFGVSLTLEYLCRCHTRYRKMVMGSLELKEILFNEDGFVEFYFQVAKSFNESFVDYYPYELYLSTNGVNDGIIKIDFYSEYELYEDAWHLFGNNNGALLDKMIGFIIEHKLGDIIMYSKKIKSLLMSGKKITISSTQKYLGIGFSKSKDVYEIINTYTKGY